MSAIEQILSIIAPYYCIECQQEGQVLCRVCSQNVFAPDDGICGLCGAVAGHGAVCIACRTMTPLSCIWTLGALEGHLEALVHMLKFEVNRSAAEVLASAMAEFLPSFETKPVIVPLPTASSRVRRRGYDQSVLIAKALARKRGFVLAPLLSRVHNLRQLGAARSQRLLQAESAYQYVPCAVATNRPLLLVDDVTTTGASLNAAARILRRAGYGRIMAVVAAKQPPEER